EVRASRRQPAGNGSGHAKSGDHLAEPQLRGRRRFARRQGRALARQPQRPHRRGHAPRQRAGVLGAISSGGVAGPARRVVPVRPVRGIDRRVEAVSVIVKVLDDVIARYAGGAHEAEVVRARGAFLEATGKVMDDEPLWEERMQAFLEWYTLERKMDGGELRPIDRYRREPGRPPPNAPTARGRAGAPRTPPVRPGSA